MSSTAWSPGEVREFLYLIGPHESERLHVPQERDALAHAEYAQLTRRTIRGVNEMSLNIDSALSELRVSCLARRIGQGSGLPIKFDCQRFSGW